MSPMSKGYISPFLKEAVTILSPPESAEWSEGQSLSCRRGGGAQQWKCLLLKDSF